MRTQLTRRNRTACSILALATALAVGPSPAAAQSIQGTPTVNAGSVTFDRSVAGVDTVIVNSQQAVVQWSPTDTAIGGGTINFQPAGTTANFVFNSGGAILNRILPNDQTRSIGLNGSINGYIGAVGGATGGSVYFYAPGGFVIGSGAVINVGSLGLSASPISYNAGTGAFINSGTVVFGQATVPTATITTNPGSTINTLNTNGYVAMVAPRVVHNGTITTNGQAALVGAEAATINFSPDGLFDITVDVGTTDANGVIIGGSIGGQQSTGFGDFNRIYAVAVPKNDALTMVITQGASLGFNIAGAVDVVGNAIVLTAGHNILDGDVAAAVAPGGGNGDASVSGQNFTATSALTMVGKTNAEIIATTTRTMHSDVTVRGTREARIVAFGANANLTIVGDATVSANLDVAAGASGTAGIAALYAGDNGLLTVQGDVDMSADAFGANSLTSGVAGGSVTGGSVRLQSQTGGTVDIWGSASLHADAYAGNASSAGANGGNAIGGSVNVGTFDTGSDISIGGHVTASANGQGGYAVCSGCDGVGGTGRGGSIFVGAANDSHGSTVTLGDFESFISLSADGFGGGSSGGSAGATGTGGTVYVWSQGVASDVQIQGDLSATADGYGGGAFDSGVNGGVGDGGNVYVLAHLTDSNLAVSGTTDLYARGFGGESGGEGCFSCNGLGGAAYGGEIYLTTSDVGPGATMSFEGLVTASVEAVGGSGVAGGGNAIAGGTAGSGSQGIVSNFAANTAIEYNAGIDFRAVGRGGIGYDGNGGNGTGGRVRVGAQGAAAGGSMTINGDAYIDVTGFGGQSYNIGNGGFGQGGQTDNGGNSGSLTVNGNFTALSLGFGGLSGEGIGGGAQGGRAWLDAFGTLINVTGNALINTSATGGAGATGGGSGIGGQSYIAATSSNYTIGGNAEVRAGGTGGGGNAGAGGYGGGGDAIIRATGGNLAIAGSALVSTDSFGGAGATGGFADADDNPSNGVGGARIRALNNSQLTIGTTATVSSRGYGGAGSGGVGGNAIGGLAQILTASGADITVGGVTRIDTDAFAGAGANGTGGFSHIFAGGGGTVTLDRLNMRADGYGGSSNGGLDAGDGYGGTAEVEAAGAGSAITVTNSILTGGTLQDREMLSADGFGGDTSIAGGTGGTGVGGTVNLRSVAGGNVSLVAGSTNGSGILLRARGYGGRPNAEGATGGIGDGGTLNLVVDGGTMTTGHMQYSSIGEGGFTTLNGLNTNGGDGIGGERRISVLNGGTLTTAILGGVAGGVGGFGTGNGNGGDASGGIATLTMNNGTLNLTAGQSTVISQMSGGEALGTGNGGDALGGSVATVNISNGSIVNVAAGATLGISANSFGGNADGAGNGGDAVAGDVYVNISDSTVNGGLMSLGAVGQAGDSIGGTAGNSAGGDAFLTLNSSSVTVQDLTIRAVGAGGWSQTGTAGSGTGGYALLIASGGPSTVTATTAVNLSGAGLGGGIYDGAGVRTGDGIGGDASIYVASGAALTINGNTTISAVGDGGELFDSETAGTPAGSGGSGDGGVASVFADTGTLTFNGNLALDASALGRSGINGTGGNALGGTAAVGTVGGNVTVNGTLSLDGSATGGNGTTGGNAVALVSNAEETDPTAASLYVQGGGNITVTGATTINVGATGGTGSSGNGGNATAGEVDIVAYIGDITLAGLALNTNGVGGNAGLGGNGGFGTGGAVDIAFGLGDAAVDGVITIDDLSVNANGTGGAGGTGAADQAGGNGGTGTGGFIYFIGSAAGGSLQTGNAILSATGIGGAGGTGGFSANGIGGAGGTGGNGVGGEIFAGTLSNSGAGGSGGDFDVGNLWIDTSAIGGNGGAGAFGGAGNGAGGNGGNAWGGGSYLLIRGVNASADAVTLIANAEGGDGGTGSVQGNGGNATTGVLQVESKDRFGFPGQRGNLVADSISAVAMATGGTGAIAGTSTVFGGSYFRVLNGDATIGSVSFTITGDLYDDSYYSDYVSVRDGTATIGSFSYSTTEALALDAGNGTMDAGTITLSAGTFRANRPGVPAPTVAGTYQAADFSITTGGDFVTIANLSSDTGLSIVAPGAISMANAHAGDLLTLDAQGGTLTAGSLTSGSLNLSALGDVSLGDLSGGSVQIDSTNGGVTFGEVLAGGNMLVNAFNGAVAGGNIALGGTLTVDADSISVGDIVGDITANDGVSLFAGSNITTGNILSDGNVSMSAFGFTSTIDVGNIDAGGYIQLIAATILGGNLSADSYISLNAGGLDTIDVGDLTGDGVYAISLGEIFTGDIVSTADVALESLEGGISTGDITAATTVDLDAAGNIVFGNASASDFNFTAGGSAQGGNILATSHADGEAEGAIVVGDVTVTGAPTDGIFSVGFQSRTSIQTGNVSAFDSAGFATTGDLTTGTIYAGNLIMALVSGDIVTGALTTGSGGQVYIGDSSMFTAAGGPDDFDEAIVLAQDPVATGGSLTVNGAIDTPVLRVAIGDAFAIGDISVEGAFAVQASSITTGDITATTFIALTSPGAIVTGDLIAGTSVTLDGASVTTGNIVAGAGAPAAAEDITVMNVGPGEEVEIFSDSSIVTGNITTDGYVGLYAADDITTGSINAEHDVIALAGGDASFGPITTPERFILAGYSNFAALNDGESFNPELIFELNTPASTGGDALFAGTTAVGDFEAWVGGNTVVASLNSQSQLFGGDIRIDSGGTIGVSGLVNASYIDFVSSNINIAPTATINATTGITFNSTNSAGTYIGDNLSGTDGYRLTQAEIERVNSPFYGFDVLPGRGAAEMMMIGDLTLDLSGGEFDEGADFEIESDEGEIEDELRGIIRIVGDVNLTSSSDTTVYFTAETVAIDAATGSLSLTDGSGGLNGLISFEANNIFVASGAIIDQLLVDPRYPGHVADLNAPAAVQRPEGVLRAGAIDFDDEASLQNLLIQNTGTASTPAGFLVLAESEYGGGEFEGGDDEDEFPPPGSINLVINGQLQSPTGNLTGAAVRDALVEDYGTIEPFTENSTINGCPVSGGSCGNTTGGPLPPEAVITPTQVAMLTSDPIGESVFGNEGDIAGETASDEGGEDGGSASSPIDAPQPLFDTRPLSSDEDLNEPISGAGNPSLYGISSDEDGDDDEEEGEGKKEGEAKPASQSNARTGDGQ